jgi:hypothetical protein
MFRLMEGSILKPLVPEKREEGVVQIVDPADYPPGLIGPPEASMDRLRRRRMAEA